MAVNTGGKWIFVSDSQTPPATPPVADPPKADAPVPAPTPPVADPPKADAPAPAPTPPVADPPKADAPAPATPPKPDDPPKVPVGTPPNTAPAFSLNSVVGMADHAAVEAVLANWDSVKAYIES